MYSSVGVVAHAHTHSHAQEYTPDSDVRSTKVETLDGEVPLGKSQWEWFDANQQEWIGLLLTISIVADRRAHLEASQRQQTERTDVQSTAPFASHAQLVGRLLQQGHTPRVLGHTVDGSPILVVQCGGTRLPAVIISAGVRATDQAGVSAAVELCDDLSDSEHTVYVLPCRDPVGMHGGEHVLSLGLGGDAEVSTVTAAASLLREQGEVLWDTGEELVALLADFGYVLQTSACTCSGTDQSTQMPRAEYTTGRGADYEHPRLAADSSALQASLAGRRIWWIGSCPCSTAIVGECSCSQLLGQTNTHIVAPIVMAASSSTNVDSSHDKHNCVASSTPAPAATADEQDLSDTMSSILSYDLDSFLGTNWAPVEVRCVRQLLAEVQPGLLIDLKEYRTLELPNISSTSTADVVDSAESTVAHGNTGASAHANDVPQPTLEQAVTAQLQKASQNQVATKLQLQDLQLSVESIPHGPDGRLSSQQDVRSTVPELVAGARQTLASYAAAMYGIPALTVQTCVPTSSEECLCFN